jgi:hypothetical protein
MIEAGAKAENASVEVEKRAATAVGNKRAKGAVNHEAGVKKEVAVKKERAALMSAARAALRAHHGRSPGADGPSGSGSSTGPPAPVIVIDDSETETPPAVVCEAKLDEGCEDEEEEDPFGHMKHGI